MKKRSLRVYTVIVLLLSLFMVGCASKSYDMESSEGSHDLSVSDSESASDTGYDGGAEVSKEDEESFLDTESGNSNLINSQDKIIRRIELSLETKDFDKFITSINKQVNELGGYIEKSQLTGRHYDSDNLRYGTIVARVPKESVDGFIHNIGDIGNIVEKEENVENITLQYLDVESHIKALEIEQDRLLALLEKAEKLEDIVTLEARLTTVRYELQRYESQIRTFDNQVDYSTVTMYIQEVRLMSSSIEKEKTIGSRIQTGLGKTLYNIKEGISNFIVFFVINIPYILIWAIIIILLIFVIRRILKKSKRKREDLNINYKIIKEKDDKYNKD